MIVNEYTRHHVCLEKALREAKHGEEYVTVSCEVHESSCAYHRKKVENIQAELDDMKSRTE